MKVLLLGAAGQVGSDCGIALIDAGFDVILSTRAEIDLSIPASVKEKLIELQPDFIVNASAYTAVDKAETDVVMADAINNQSVGCIAEYCGEYDIPLLHISTDYVFDGSSKVPYKEADHVSPLGVYGKTKLDGERSIEKKMNAYIILRTSWVFGEQGNNFVKTMLRLGVQRDEISVVDDQIGRPTYVGDIVNTIVFFVCQYNEHQALPWGTYHCCSQGQVSWYGFAQEIFETAVTMGLLIKRPLVKAITSSDYPTPAPRPAFSVLDTTKLESLLSSPLPHWQRGLRQFIQHELQQTN